MTTLENTNHAPRLLPVTFRRHGYTYSQIARNDHSAIYKMEKDGHAAYEVIRIHQAVESFKFPSGAEIRAGDESYPPSSEWGKHGWTVTTESRAWEKFQKVSGVTAPAIS